MVDKDYNTEKEDARELVEFVSEAKDAALGNSERELQDVLKDKMQHTIKRRKHFKLSRILGNPVTGGIILFDGIAILFSIFTFDTDVFVSIIIGTILIILGIICIIWGIRNITFTVRSAQNVYEVINEKEQQVENSGKGQNRVSLLKNSLLEGVVGIIFLIGTFAENASLFDRIFAFVFAIIFFLCAIFTFSDFIKETKKRENGKKR